ncbi:hypothetical protein I6O00_24910, partial [Enterobacter hormaechei]|uniref:BREX system Lon protease-like protein BrxL n=1 Tax=Enterobacter hormaechei TaxID=158836 RepID=UPI001C8BA0D6
MDGELISDSHELTFDFASDNPRERELSVRFILSRKADEANNQQVELRLEEQVEGTSHFTQYKATRYTIRRSFSSEFDFFEGAFMSQLDEKINQLFAGLVVRKDLVNGVMGNAIVPS